MILGNKTSLREDTSNLKRGRGGGYDFFGGDRNNFMSVNFIKKKILSRTWAEKNIF